MKTISNFLEKKDFEKIHKFFMTESEFPWYKSEVLNGIDDIQFTHRFYDNFQPLSPLMNVLTPLIDRINPKALIRIKANLLTRTEKKIIHGFHTDFPNVLDCTTAIYYVNTNNGETIFKNGEKIVSEENKFISFSSGLEHSGTTNTCSNKCRIVINFNYY
jgi:hypothetical protein